MAQKILTVINHLVAALMLISICAADSASIVPMIIFAACLGWFFVYNLLFW